jgi:hypothetical protein
MLQVEIQVRKIYCINRVIPTLPINVEDAARSEAEFEKAEQVSSMQVMCSVCILFSKSTQFCVPSFLNFQNHTRLRKVKDCCCNCRLERSLFVLDRIPA